MNSKQFFVALLMLAPTVVSVSAVAGVSRPDYEGREADAPWRKQAGARIEQIRKAPLKVCVVDDAGNPIRGATVHISQRRHAFGYLERNGRFGNQSCGRCLSLPDRVH